MCVQNWVRIVVWPSLPPRTKSYAFVVTLPPSLDAYVIKVWPLILKDKTQTPHTQNTQPKHWWWCFSVSEARSASRITEWNTPEPDLNTCFSSQESLLKPFSGIQYWPLATARLKSLFSFLYLAVNNLVLSL